MSVDKKVPRGLLVGGLLRTTGRGGCALLLLSLDAAGGGESDACEGASNGGRLPKKGQKRLRNGVDRGAANAERNDEYAHLRSSTDRTEQTAKGAQRLKLRFSARGGWEPKREMRTFRTQAETKQKGKEKERKQEGVSKGAYLLFSNINLLFLERRHGAARKRNEGKGNVAQQPANAKNTLLAR